MKKQARPLFVLLIVISLLAAACGGVPLWGAVEDGSIYLGAVEVGNKAVVVAGFKSQLVEPGRIALDCERYAHIASRVFSVHLILDVEGDVILIAAASLISYAAGAADNGRPC